MSLLFIIVPFVFGTVVVDPDAEQPRLQHDITQYVPDSGEIKGWETVGTPQVFVGESLYAYINGGATIYSEYGFKRVIVQEYVHPGGSTVVLEVFEMTSSASAYGVYTFKTRSDTQAVAVGSEARRGDYYVNFWKGRFVVTLTASDSREETFTHVLTLAHIIDSKIEHSAARPSIVDLMPRERAEPTSLVYVKGNTALANVTSFFSDDIFGVREGLVGDYDGLSVFIFKYSSGSKSFEWFQNAKEHLRDSNRVVRVITGKGLVSFSTTDEEHITVRHCENYILVSLWKAAAVNPDAVLQLIQAKIREPR